MVFLSTFYYLAKTEVGEDEEYARIRRMSFRPTGEDYNRTNKVVTSMCGADGAPVRSRNKRIIFLFRSSKTENRSKEKAGRQAREQADGQGTGKQASRVVLGHIARAATFWMEDKARHFFFFSKMRAFEYSFPFYPRAKEPADWTLSRNIYEVDWYFYFTVDASQTQPTRRRSGSFSKIHGRCC